MEENIKIDDDMKNFKVEDLAKVMDANQTVTESIKDFMENWKTLKKFSRMKWGTFFIIPWTFGGKETFLKGEA